MEDPPEIDNDIEKALQSPRGFRLQRRQFLANLLFAGGALTLTGLQSAHALDHPTDGWTLPDLNKVDPQASPTPPPKPPPRPPEPRGRRLPPKPPTPPPGAPLPPGTMTPPRPKGAVAPPSNGDVVRPQPKKNP